jgi:hypothetical protein
MYNERSVLYFTETHRLGLFSQEEYLAAFRQNGLEVVHDPEGLTGLGIIRRNPQ